MYRDSETWLRGDPGDGGCVSHPDDEIEVSVRRGEVTLRGTVPSRSIRRMAEEFFEDLPGVKHVTNLLLVAMPSSRS